MKRYIRASNGYEDIFKKIVNYFEKFAKDSGATYTTYNDYVVEPDWAGGGMRISLQWDGDSPSEDEVVNKIESHFGFGIKCSDSFGDWDHQITVHVDGYRCR